MRALRRSWLLGLLLGLACSDSSGPVDQRLDDGHEASPGDSARDRAAGDASVDRRGAGDGRREGGPGGDVVGDARPVKVLSPSEYDCTSVAGGPPARASTVPLSCIIDPSCTTPLVCAHRGAGADSQEITSGLYLPIGKFAPENTLLAIRWAIRIGADSVELDVRSTSDGQLVLMHDTSVKRTTNGTGDISGLTLAQIQALQLKTGQFKGSWSCAKVPTFDEALTLAKGRINVVVDVKTSAADKVALAVQQAGMVDQAFISASDTTKLSLARSAVSTIRLQARTGDTSQVSTLLAAFTPPPSVMELEEAIVTAANLTTVHAKGAKVSVDGFTYDVQGYLTGKPQSYAALVARKADQMMVDRVDLLLNLLGR